MDEKLREPGWGTMRAMHTSGVCIVMIDAERSLRELNNNPTRRELVLIKMCTDHGKAVVLAVNKWDLIPEDRAADVRARILKRVEHGMSQVKGLPVVFLSATRNENVDVLTTRLMALYKRWNARVPTAKLNSFMQDFMRRWPPPWKDGQKCYPKYITQLKVRPPTFALYTNVYGQFPKNYLRQMQNLMRQEFNMTGTPIHFIMRVTMTPNPKKKLTKAQLLKWKRMGPKQAMAIEARKSGERLRSRERRVKQTE